MTTVVTPQSNRAGYQPTQSTLTNAIDRWIYVFMAVSYIAITLTGFIPDSLAKIAAVEAGQRDGVTRQKAAKAKVRQRERTGIIAYPHVSLRYG